MTKLPLASRRQFAASLLAPLAFARTELPIVLSCSPHNDLYRALLSANVSMHRYSSPEQAILSAPAKAGVLILSDAYPDTVVPLSGKLLSQAKEKTLRVYAEYALLSA